MTSLDLDRFRAALELERDRIRAALDSVNHSASAMDETGELATGPGDHLADHATDTYMRELDEGLGENAEHILSEIDDALRRIDGGTYGTCTACGRPIAEDRLEALPYASLCIDDKRAQEGR